MSDSIQALIKEHVEQHIGAIGSVYATQDENSDLRILHVPPTDTRPAHTLITLGLSERPMSVSKPDAPARIELMMTLPRTWQLGSEPPRDEQWSWPIGLLRSLAARAQTAGGWIGWGHMIPNGDPPQPYAHTTKQCVALIAPSLLVPTAFYELKLPSGEGIVFYAVMPIYREEYELGQASGTDALFTRLIDRDVNDVIDPNRGNAAKKKFWIF